MIYKNDNLGLAINISTKLLNELVEIGTFHYPNEIGGFLIGYYSDDFKLLNITENILPEKYISRRNTFERSTEGIFEKLEEFFNENPSKYYIGEWHTHPEGSPYPSSLDVKVINNIRQHDQVSIQSPLMLIIGNIKKEVEFGFFVLYENKLYRYE